MRQLVYQVYYTRYHVSFYLCLIGSVLKHFKVPKYYDHDCRLIRICRIQWCIFQFLFFNFTMAPLGHHRCLLDGAWKIYNRYCIQCLIGVTWSSFKRCNLKYVLIDLQVRLKVYTFQTFDKCIWKIGSIPTKSYFSSLEAAIQRSS